MKEKDKKRLAVVGIAVVFILIALFALGPFSVINTGGVLNFYHQATKASFLTTDSPSFELGNKQYSQTCGGTACNYDMAIGVRVTKITIDNNPSLTADYCNMFIYHFSPENEAKWVNGVYQTTPKVISEGSMKLSYSIPPQPMGSHTIKIEGYYSIGRSDGSGRCQVGSNDPLSTTDTFTVTSMQLAQPENATQKTISAPANDIQGVATYAAVALTTAVTSQGNTTLFAYAIIVVLAILLVLLIAEQFVFKRKK